MLRTLSPETKTKSFIHLEDCNITEEVLKAIQILLIDS